MPDIEREARIARGTDARCLAQMLSWLRRTYLLLPIGSLWAWLAWQVGVGWWAVAWFIAWVGLQVQVWRTASQLQVESALPPSVGIARATRLFWAAGCLHAALLPVFFFGTTVEIKLAITLLTIWLSGSVMISSSGIREAFAGVALPPAVPLMVGWLWQGSVLGYGLALLSAGSSFVGFVTVRQQRRAWEELVRLVDDNRALAVSLEIARDRAEAASESKTRFFAAASHDLRQPLHALSINATTLELVARRSGDGLLRDLSQGIGSALRQSRALLDVLLDISRLDAHAVRLHLDAHDVDGLLESVREQYAVLAAQRGLSINVTVDSRTGAPWVRTDADQLRRILGNLTDNAIKFTAQGGVTLSWRYAGPERVVISVSDTGRGIAQSERGRVFEEFYQVGNPSRHSREGLGLGLAIVRRTAALLDIEVRLTSELGCGTTFELHLAAASGSTRTLTESAESSLPEVQGSLLSVLLIDDEPEVLASVRTYLTQIGWHVQEAGDGDGALQVLESGLPIDVVVVDYRLRDQTGLDVLSRLREFKPNLPAVVVTGDTAPERLSELAGATAHILHKPVDGTNLAKVLLTAAQTRL